MQTLYSVSYPVRIPYFTSYRYLFIPRSTTYYSPTASCTHIPKYNTSSFGIEKGLCHALKLGGLYNEAQAGNAEKQPGAQCLKEDEKWIAVD